MRRPFFVPSSYLVRYLSVYPLYFPYSSIRRYRTSTEPVPNQYRTSTSPLPIHYPCITRALPAQEVISSEHAFLHRKYYNERGHLKESLRWPLFVAHSGIEPLFIAWETIFLTVRRMRPLVWWCKVIEKNQSLHQMKALFYLIKCSYLSSASLAAA